jgi:hypothetical protein
MACITPSVTDPKETMLPMKPITFDSAPAMFDKKPPVIKPSENSSLLPIPYGFRLALLRPHTRDHVITIVSRE